MAGNSYTNASIFIYPFECPVGSLILGEYQEKLCLCDWQFRKKRNQIDIQLQKKLHAGFIIKKTVLIHESIRQLEAYFTKKRKNFNIPLLMTGSEFQQFVWTKLLTIPYGSTITYSALAEMTGDKNRQRAVAAANGANVLSIFIPCHRVIGTNGDLTGYAGGLKAKRSLLELEGSIRSEQLSIF